MRESRRTRKDMTRKFMSSKSAEDDGEENKDKKGKNNTEEKQEGE